MNTVGLLFLLHEDRSKYIFFVYLPNTFLITEKYHPNIANVKVSTCQQTLHVQIVQFNLIMRGAFFNNNCNGLVVDSK